MRALTPFFVKISVILGLAFVAGCASHQAGLEQKNTEQAAIASADKHGAFIDPTPAEVKAKHETRIQIEEAVNASVRDESVQAVKTAVETEENTAAAIVSLDEPSAGEAVRLTEDVVDDLQVIESRWSKLSPEEREKVLNIILHGTGK